MGYGTSGKVTGTGGSAVTDTYSYDAHDKLTGISGGTNKSYGYDSNGNCTSVTVGTSVTSVAYDVENRVTQITYPSSATNTFAYNGEDLRTQKVDSGGTKNYVCDGSSPASAVLKDGSAVYTPGLSERRGSASKFLHADALGSTRGVTDSSQSVTDSMLYDAFGNVLSRTGTTPTPFGFVGSKQYQTDSDSGLQLLGHRYYDPSIGRFLSQDPIQDGTNWYAYCDNNPLKAVDPTGLTSDLPPLPDPLGLFNPPPALGPVDPSMGGGVGQQPGGGTPKPPYGTQIPTIPAIPPVPAGVPFPIFTDDGIGIGTGIFNPFKGSGGGSALIPFRLRPGKDPRGGIGAGFYFPGKGKVQWGVGIGLQWGPDRRPQRDPMDPGPFLR